MRSDRKPILLVSSSESGLINSLLIVAAELSRRGTRDLFFATDENRRADVEAIAVDTPVTFVSLGDVVAELSAVTWDDQTYQRVTQRSPFKSMRETVRKTFVPGRRLGKYQTLEAAVEKIQPKVMIIDVMCQFGGELAITKKIPFILSAPFVPSNFLSAIIPFAKSYTPPDFPVPRSGLPVGMSFTQRLANRLFRWRTLGALLSPSMLKRAVEDRRIRKAAGIAHEANWFMAKIELAELVLCYSLAELDYPFSIPEKVKLVGAMVPPLPENPDDTDDTGLSEWLDSHESVVYVGLGTITRLTRSEVAAMVEVARRLGSQHQVLWKLPAEQQQLLPQASMPENLRITAWVPSQLDVLAHPNVKVFFNHGGANGFHEGLYFGKPLVIRPLWVDCHDQAVRGQGLGVSLTLDRPETIDPDDVVDKITRVLTDGSFRERAERFGRLQREAGGRTTSADLILDLVGR